MLGNEIHIMAAATGLERGNGITGYADIFGLPRPAKGTQGAVVTSEREHKLPR